MRTTNWSLIGLVLAAIGCASDNDATTASAAGAAGAAGAPSASSAAGAPSAAGTAGAAGMLGTAGTAGVAAHKDSADPLGVYVDDYGFSLRVDATSWSSASDLFTIVKFDSTLDLAIAQNAATNQFYPGKFSRFDWATGEDGKLRYCQSAYDAETEAAAAAVPRANEKDWKQGCSGFPWSALAAPAIVGAFADDWGGTHTITAQSWTMGGSPPSQFTLLELSNTHQYLIAVNGLSNPYSAGKFSRFDWTLEPTGALYYCQTRYDAETQADARAAVAADATDLKKGCGSFAWSKLTPVAP